MNSTRHPFSTSASPMAAARWLVPLLRADQLTGRQKLAAKFMSEALPLPTPYRKSILQQERKDLAALCLD